MAACPCSFVTHTHTHIFVENFMHSHTFKYRLEFQAYRCMVAEKKRGNRRVQRLLLLISSPTSDFTCGVVVVVLFRFENKRKLIVNVVARTIH